MMRVKLFVTRVYLFSSILTLIRLMRNIGCGLYYKIHGSARPISLKYDVIRKRSRHDARRSEQAMEDTPYASPGVSRRASPALDASPTLAPDSTAQMTYEYLVSTWVWCTMTGIDSV